jgi:hypothetical protein
MTLHFKQVIAFELIAYNFYLELCELIDSTNTTQNLLLFNFVL